MPSVAELTAVYGNFLISPRHGADVCERCFNLTDGFERCYACSHTPQFLDLVAPISYSVGGEQLHHALASYKRLTGEAARRFTVELAAVIWRHLADHERCIRGPPGSAPSGSRSSHRSLDRPQPGRAAPAAADRRRARRADPRPLRAAPAAFRRAGSWARVQPRQVRADPRARSGAGAADRRHVDDGGQRSQCRQRAQGGRRRHRRRARDRPSPEPRLAPERQPPARPQRPLRAGGVPVL